MDPPLEIYDHTRALALHSYDGDKYAANDAADQARMRAELLDLRRHRWELSSLCVALRPGHVVELVGCPNADLDQRYIVVGLSAHGSASEGVAGEYRNHVSVIPHDMPFRPARRTPSPVISGHQTAVVVGPSDQEIHTDEHGRVQVKFHWDREHDPSAHNDCSCWIRVMHSWAGPGFGTTFVPRVGMEVVVTFLYGDPDQPLVVGCVYHGTHHSPVVTPDDKTQSAIRTKSSPNSDGFNELRFEDKAGSEFIFTHAQKDYNEVVEHNHSTHVKVDQSNTVDHDQTETVGRDQTMTVKRDRMKSVDGNETSFIGGGDAPGNREETVWGNEDVSINQNRTHTVIKDESLTVTEGKRTVHVQTGKNSETYDGGRAVAVKAFDNLHVTDGANRNVTVTDGQYNVKVGGAHYALTQKDTEKFIQASPKTYIESSDELEIKVGPSRIVVKSDGTILFHTTSSILMECGASKMELTPGSIALDSPEIQLTAGPSALKLEASKATLKGAMVDLLADMFATIKGTLVRIN